MPVSEQKTILLVEDDYLISANEAQQLESQGYKVICAHTGEKAVELVCGINTPVDLILLDIDLGKGIDGTDAAKTILETHDIPIVFLSSHSERKIVDKTDKITSYGYVLKNSGEIVLEASVKMAFKLFDANKRILQELIERKKAEKEIELLLERERKASKAINETLERVSDAFVSLDSNWCYTYMNKKAGEIFNRDPAKMTGKHIWTEFPEGVDQPFQKAYEKAFNEQTYVYLEEYYPPYDKWFLNHIYPSLDGVSIFFQDITLQKKNEQIIRNNEERFRNAIENSPYPIAIYNDEGKILHLSQGWIQYSGYSLSDIPTSEDWVLKAYPTTMEDKRTIIKDLYSITETYHNGEIEIRTKSGEKRVWDFYTTPIGKTVDGKKMMLTTADDITQRINDNEKILQLYNEKDLLLKEIHHRIKNNTAIIKSLLDMQSRSVKSPEAVSAFKDAMSRLDTMIVLHDKLYRTDNYKNISIKDYLSHLIDETFLMFTSGQKISIIKDIDDFVIDSKLLFSIGILLNELITNTIKYAFKDRNSGTVKLSVKKNNSHVTVIFEDDGIGINLNEDQNPKGFGLQIVDMLISQIQGNCILENRNGTKYTIEFDSQDK